MSIIIKRMETEEEIRGKAYVHWQSWHEAYPDIVSREYLEKMTLEKCEQMAFTWPRNTFIALDDGRVVGFVCWGSAGEEFPETGEIIAIYILAEYYGTGLGLRLMEAGLEQLKEYPQVCLWVLKDNPRAVRFYQKCGFAADGEEKYRPSLAEAVIRMVRKQRPAMKIETERLVITEFSPDMAQVVHENSLDEDNRRFVPDEVFETVEDARDAISFLMSQYGRTEGPLAYPVLIRNSGENIGYVQMVPLDGGVWEIGYHIAKKHTGKGYATEAVQAFLPVMAEAVGIGEVYGICLQENAASRHVLAKCGFIPVFEGVSEYQGEPREVFKSIWSRKMTDHHTLDWYRDHMEEFVSHTGNVDMTPQYRAFMELLPAGSRIMDLGCGAGGASVYFTRAGYSVLAVDGCRELCEYTRQRAGCETRHMFFEELDDEDAFDGVWACASLLHVPKAGLPGILRRIHRALKKDGVFYASFKYGETEREKNGRRFSDFTEDSLRALLDEAGGFRVKTLWVTHDARPERSDERWVNVLCLAEKE